MKKDKKIKKNKQTFKEVIKLVWRQDKISVIRIVSLWFFIISLVTFATGLSSFIVDIPNINIPFLVLFLLSFIVLVSSISTWAYYEKKHSKL